MRFFMILFPYSYYIFLALVPLCFNFASFLSFGIIDFVEGGRLEFTAFRLNRTLPKSAFVGGEEAPYLGFGTELRGTKFDTGVI